MWSHPECVGHILTNAVKGLIDNCLFACSKQHQVPLQRTEMKGQIESLMCHRIDGASVIEVQHQHSAHCAADNSQAGHQSWQG